MDWTERYRPQTLADVRGNDDAVRELKKWAATWDTHNEAVILYGKPGIGKTSAAHALAAEKDWEVIELNASDQRTGDVIKRVAGEAAQSGTLTGGLGGKKLVVLDEADNLHGNHDRGGAAAITKVVKNAGQPMVLIANDFYGMSNALRRACEDIEFKPVSKKAIGPAIRDIADAEGIPYEIDGLKAIAEKNDGDMRGAVNDLQALARPDSTLTADDVITGDRDTEEGIFEYLDVLLKNGDAESARNLSMQVDETPDSLINWIDDNVPKVYTTEELAAAYESLSNADTWLGRVQATQDYSYWRYAGDAMTAGVAAARSGTHGGWTRYGPPSYWRKLGSSKGTRNTRDHIAREIAETSGMSIESVRNDVLPYLSDAVHHCANRELCVRLVAEYDLSKKHLSFLTGSGEDTNKIASIIEDAEELLLEQTVENSGGAFLDQFGSSAAEDDSAAAFEQAFADDEGESRGISDFITGDDTESGGSSETNSDSDLTDDDDSESRGKSPQQSGLADF